MASQRRTGVFAVENAYPRAVDDNGNPRAREILARVFRPADALWRGLGTIPASGLAVAPAFERFDALVRLGMTLPETRPLPGCRCGEVLKGKLAPNQCPLFGTVCSPANPVGPCMVSRKGAVRPTSSIRYKETGGLQPPVSRLGSGLIQMPSAKSRFFSRWQGA